MNRVKSYINSLTDDPEKIVGLVIFILLIFIGYSLATGERTTSNKPYLEQLEDKEQRYKERVIEEREGY